jgi:hypothetical protein
MFWPLLPENFLLKGRSKGRIINSRTIMTISSRCVGLHTCLGSLLLLACAPVSACLDQSSLNALADKEMQYLLQRIPPAFADAVSDHLIQGQMTLQAADACQVHWQLTLPAADIAEAQALLQAEPAKQIMLAAQGYQIPEQVSVEADFAVDPATLQPKHQEVLQTAPLGKLRASVELMYAMLTQARTSGGQGAQTPWTQAELQSTEASCQQQFRAEDREKACACYSHGLAEKYSARQVKYNRYLMTNPYAFATGNGGDFKQLDKSLRATCGLAL